MSALGYAVGFLPDRREIAPDSVPYTGLARVTAGGGVGCGFLIGSDLLLTCAHVVADPNGVLYQGTVVELGVGSKLGVRTAKIRYAYVPPKDVNDGPASGTDWAIVRIDKPLGLIYGWADCKPLRDDEWSKVELELVGLCDNPEEARREFVRMSVPYRCPCLVRDVESAVVFHDAAIWGGTSGAVILARDNAGLRVVAVNSAEVSSSGDSLIHGFRADYKKELANIAVPAKNWMSQLESVERSSSKVLRRLWVRNTSRISIRLCVRYRSIFAENPGTHQVTDWKTIKPGARIVVLEPADGCEERKVEVSFTDMNGNSFGTRQFLEREVAGEMRKFFEKDLGTSSDYTLRLP